MKKWFSMIQRKTSLHRVETIYQIISGIIVRLNMISFVAYIVLNNCVYILKIKWVSSINDIILSKHSIWMITMRKSVMVFQLISSENWQIIFHNHWWKIIDKHSLQKNVSLKKKCNTDTSIWTHVLRLGWISSILW